MKELFQQQIKFLSLPLGLCASPSEILLDVRKTLIVDMVMVEGVTMGVFLYFCVMRSCAISLFLLERPTTT
jgi:hypothetical protein